jgi:Cof subfamily protein (haloacid dehalogenase superfamily)
MFKPSLVLSDIDGTLLTSDKRILEPVKRAIQALQVPFVLVSGRLLPSMRLLCQELGIMRPDSFFVGIGGCVVARGDALLSDIRLDKAIGHRILERLRGLEGTISLLYDPESWSCSTKGFWTEREERITMVKGNFPVDLDAVLERQGASKILVESFAPRVLDDALAILEDEFGDDVDLYKSSPLSVEVMPKTIDKSSCFDILCKELGIGPESIMAIGDYYNDESMLRKAGLAVAMGNAPDDIKSICAHVTDDCDHGGLAKALERFAL